MPKRIFAGELERREASETVKLTVVGDGRRTRRRPGMLGQDVKINREASPRSETKLKLHRDLHSLVSLWNSVRFPRSRALQLFISIHIGSDLSGANSTFLTLTILLWVTVREVGPLSGKTGAAEIAPRRQEAFDGRRSGAMMIPATITTAGLTEDIETGAIDHAHLDETGIPTEMGTDPEMTTETDGPAMITIHRAKTERRKRRRRRRKRNQLFLSLQSP